jgi:glycosyltransferase involved in cell wall biosynthesis
VEDGINGYVVQPEPEAIAQAIDGLYSDKEKAVRLGKAGYDKLKALDITWDKVARSLIE